MLWLFVSLASQFVVSGCNRIEEAATVGSGHHSNTNQTARAVTREKLIEGFARNDFQNTIEALNTVKRMSNQGDIIVFLENIWREGSIREYGVHPSFLSHPRIRLEIADVLAQASRNGWKGLPPLDEYATYARLHVSDRDPEVARQAIIVLGIIRTPQDMDLLSKIVREENPATMRAAVWSLAHICEFSVDNLYKLAFELKSHLHQNQVIEVWESSEPGRQFTCR